MISNQLLLEKAANVNAGRQSRVTQPQINASLNNGKDIV